MVVRVALEIVPRILDRRPSLPLESCAKLELDLGCRQYATRRPVAGNLEAAPGAGSVSERSGPGSRLRLWLAHASTNRRGRRARQLRRRAYQVRLLTCASISGQAPIRAGERERGERDLEPPDLGAEHAFAEEHPADGDAVELADQATPSQDPIECAWPSLVQSARRPVCRG